MVKKKYRLGLGVVLMFLVIILSWNYARPESLVDRGEGFYATNEATTTVKDEYMPIWVQEKPKARFEKKAMIVSGEGEINKLAFDSKKTTC